LTHLFKVRFAKNHECPKYKRETTWHLLKSAPAFSCGNCGNHIHPCVGKIFEDSKTSLQLWFYAIYLFTTTCSGVSAKELQLQLGVTYKTAGRMGHQIRKHMSQVDVDEPT
jgi:transposase